ncbi:hypothetical protein GCM10022232_88060 [Streptomyces plumbiresistens]|uniref:Uncharacterized protein n=1 Tax=Streptomyces plumbiresistens TaxID=511811 RepID=A0ABP7TMY3_9ACTN
MITTVADRPSSLNPFLRRGSYATCGRSGAFRDQSEGMAAGDSTPLVGKSATYTDGSLQLCAGPV